MAFKKIVNKAQTLRASNSLANTPITVGDYNRLVDELNEVKIYQAFLDQASTEAPVATVIRNDFYDDIVWSYLAVGKYAATLEGAFTEYRTVVISPTNWSGLNDSGAERLGFAAHRDSSNAVHLHSSSFNTAGVSAQDNGLLTAGSSFIEIRVYPQ